MGQESGKEEVGREPLVPRSLLSGVVNFTLRIREDMGDIPLEIPINEPLREIAVSFDPKSRGVDLTLQSGVTVSITIPPAKIPRRNCIACRGEGVLVGKDALTTCFGCGGTGVEA